MTVNIRAIERVILVIILLAYSVLAILFAVRVPDWQTPDEPAHYNVIAQIVETGRYPVIAMGDWDQAYLSALTASRFDPALLDDLDSVQYEDHQPAGYYLLAAPVYALTDGSLTALRLFSAAWGVFIVLCAYGIGRLMVPARPWIGLGAAAFVAFLPQHMHILASVNNDTLAWAIVAIALYMTIAYLKPERVGWVRPWHLGLIVGFGLVTKATTYFLGGVVGLAILYRWWLETDNPRADLPVFIRAAALYLIPALALGALWWGRNLIEYGFPDFLGLIAHDEVVVGQPRTAEAIDTRGMEGYLRFFGETALNSFVGRFGWMGVPMNGWSYWVFLGLMAVGLSGAAFAVAFPVQRERTNRGPWGVLLLTIILALLAFVYYNLTFLQPQGRYTYPLLIPLGLLIALGLETWLRLLLRALPISETGDGSLTPYWLVPLVLLGTAPVTLWLLWRVIVPNLEYTGV